MDMCMPKELRMTPRRMASDLQMPWHNLGHFCCATFCHSESRLLLNPPSPVSQGYRTHAHLLSLRRPGAGEWRGEEGGDLSGQAGPDDVLQRGEEAGPPGPIRHDAGPGAVGARRPLGPEQRGPWARGAGRRRWLTCIANASDP